MAGVLLSLFVIFLINDKVLSHIDTREDFQSPLINDIGLPLMGLINTLNGLSEHSKNISMFQNNSIQFIKSILLNNLDYNEDFLELRTEMDHYNNKIEYWYSQSLQYKQNLSLYSNNTLQNFIDSVLLRNENLPNTLHSLYMLIFPNHEKQKLFLSIYYKTVQNNYENLCDTYISPQIYTYLIFSSFINVELKGLAAISQAFLLRHQINNENVTGEYRIVKRKCYERLMNYYEKFIDAIGNYPRDVRRCNIKNPQHSDNIIELKGLFQVIVRNECNIRKKISNPFICSSGSCEDIVSTNTHDQFLVYNCKTSKNVEGCPVEYSNGRLRFSWWRTDSRINGHYKKCNNNLMSLSSYLTTGFTYNDVCVCSVNFTDTINYSKRDNSRMNFTMPEIMKISTQPQLSDIANNMVVVGVQFILHDNAIHLQIKQGKVQKDGYISNSSQWKSVDVDKNYKKKQIYYQHFFDKRNILYLDDIEVDPYCVVTGVKFEKSKNNKGYELHVHSTNYNFNTGQLGNVMKWYKPGEYPDKHRDYQRERIEIKLNDPDDASMADNYHSDSQTNKFIQFQHSSIEKDAGYHTVPFFDGQPVETSPNFILSGIGLFHRGLDGFGGYIAPRLFTYNVNWALISSYDNWKRLYDTNN